MLNWGLSKKVLVEFRAGRMIMDVNTSLIKPDTRKGLIQLVKIGEKAHFLWKDRTTYVVEEYFPIPEQRGAIEVSWVRQCTTGRVFLIEMEEHFSSGSRSSGGNKRQCVGQKKKLFFWLQEPPNAEREYECYTKLKFYIGDTSPAEEFEDFKLKFPQSKTTTTTTTTSSDVPLSTKYSVEDLDSICKKLVQENETKSPPRSPSKPLKEDGDEIDQINFTVQGIDIQQEPSEEEIWNKLEKAETDFNERNSKKRKLHTSSSDSESEQSSPPPISNSSVELVDATSTKIAIVNRKKNALQSYEKN